MEVDADECVEAISSRYCFIYKTVVSSGIFGKKPRNNFQCVVSITEMSLGGQILDVTESFSEYLSTRFSGIVHIGHGNTFVDKGLETCIQTLNANEKSTFTLLFPQQMSCALIEKPPENSTVVKCTIYMKGFSHPNDIYEMSDAQLYEEVLGHKCQGVELFKAGRTVDAFLRFSRAFKLLCFMNKSGENVSTTDVKHLELSVLNDMALCQFKFGNFHYAAELSTKALKLDPHNEKSLYRRAVALMELKYYNNAEDDLMALLKIKPSCQLATDKYKELKVLTKEADVKYAAIVKKMFS